MAGRVMRKLGLSASLSNGFETIGFTSMTMLAGQMGTLSLDAYSLSHNLVSNLFMVGLGLAVASGVRVSIELGRDRPDEAAFAGWTGLLAAVVFMGILGLLVLINREAIAAVYTDDPEIAERTMLLFVFAAFVFVPESAQVVMGQALRALEDAWFAVACYIGAFVVLMVSLGWALVNPLGFDERGLIGAIIAAGTAVTEVSLVDTTGRAVRVPALTPEQNPLRQSHSTSGFSIFAAARIGPTSPS